MCHDALTCAVLYCVVDQVVLCIRLLAELIWILNSSCLNPWLAQSWPQSKRAGRSTSLSSRSDSVPKRDEARGEPERRPNTKPRTTPQNNPRKTPQNTPRMTPRNTPRDTPRNIPRDTPRNIPRDTPRNIPRDTPRNNRNVRSAEPTPAQDPNHSRRCFANKPASGVQLLPELIWILSSSCACT